MIPYSEFEQLLKDNQIEEVYVRQGYLEGKLQNPLPDGGDRFITTRVDPQLADRPSPANVKFTGVIDSTWLRTLLRSGSTDGGSSLVLKKPALCQIESATRFFSAHRAGLNPVIVPKWNRRDLDELPEDVCQSMTFISVEMIDEVLHASLRTGTETEGL